MTNHSTSSYAIIPPQSVDNPIPDFFLSDHKVIVMTDVLAQTVYAKSLSYLLPIHQAGHTAAVR